MKLTVTLIVALTILASGSSATEQEPAEETIFERTFRTLHSEPPVPAPKNRKAIETSWIEQKLDHFNDKDDRTWQMRYMANDEFYKSGGPIFIYVGGEWGISPGAISGGHVYDMASEHNGYLFYTEHRYYGQSRPTSDLSNENIKYLSVDQALADLAHFIRTMKATIPGMANSKVILTGGSYSATMVVWFKKLYPELATGCWASSAPLLAKFNFAWYKEETGEAIRLVGGEACYKRINNAIYEMETMFANRRGAEIKAMLKLCNNFDDTNDLDVWTLFSEISDIFAGVVQTHIAGQIEGVCEKVMEGDDDLNGLANFLKLYFGTQRCADLTYKSSIATVINSVYSNNIMRQWFYQTCNEFGWYQTSDSFAQPFGSKFPIELYSSICYDVYGTHFTEEYIVEQIAKTNTKFGGLQPNVENVYLTHGQLDPWRAVGIEDETQATIIPGHAHCKDLGSIHPSDSPELRASKEKIAALVREWVGSPTTQ